MSVRLASTCIAWLASGLILAIPCRAQSPEAKDFANHVLPILRANCIACHNAQKAEGGLNLETHELLLKGGDSGPSLAIGKSAESELLTRITASDDSLMPPAKNAVGAKHLTPEEIALITAWIDAGAIAGTAKLNAAMLWKPLPDNVRPMYAIDATADGQFVAAGRGNSVGVYRWPASDAASDVAMLIDPAVQSQLQTTSPVAHLDLVQSIAISPDGQRIATGGFRDVKLWRRNVGPIGEGLAAMLRGSRTVALSPNGSMLLKASNTSSLEIIQTASASVSHTAMSPAPVLAATWSSDNSQWWISCEDASVQRFVMDPQPAAGPSPVAANFTQKLEQPLKHLTLVDAQTLVGVTGDRKLQWWQLAQPAPDAPPALTKLDRNGDIADIVSIARFEEAGTPRLAVASADGTVRIVQGTDGGVVRAIGHGGPIVQVLASGDSTKLATLGADGSVKAWNVADGNMLWEQKVDFEGQRRLDRAETIAARQKSKVERAVAKIPEMEKAKQAEMEAQGKLQASRTPVTEELTKKQTELDAMNKMVADGEAAMQAAKQAVEEAMKKAEQAQKDLDAKKQQQIAAQKAKSDVEMKLATLDKTIAGATQAIERAATALSQFQMMVEQEKAKQAELENQLNQTRGTLQTAPAVRGVFTPDHRGIVTAHNDGTIHLVRSDKGTPQAVLTGGLPNVSGLLMTAPGMILATADDGRAMGWDWGNRWSLERTIGNVTESPFSDRVTALDWSDDGQLLVVGSGAPSRFGELKLIRTADGSVAKDWGQVHSDTILVAKISPDGTTVATGAADKLVRLHRLDADAPTRTLEGHTHHVLGVAWHDDGHWLASSSADNTIKLWDVESGTAIRTIPGFGKEVTSLAFVGRSNQILSTSADQQARLHDASNGSLVRAMGGPADALYCATIAGKLPVALAGGQDGVLWIWQLDNGQALQQIK
ncbi:MAG: c-type cytochrome domain-containing protein [Pirellula sp.]